MDWTFYVAKTKALISFAVTAKLISVFVFAYAKCWFSHDPAQIQMHIQEKILPLGLSFPSRICLNIRTIFLPQTGVSKTAIFGYFRKLDRSKSHNFAK